jgi:xanthine dehydrogenase accessory factor
MMHRIRRADSPREKDAAHCEHIMRDILTDVDRWHRDGRSIALATVVHTWGSSPRSVGAKMALTPDGGISSSVSGGCVEGAVYEAGIESLETNRPRLLHFGVADETAWEVGLACGGSLDIFVKPLDKGLFPLLRSAWMDERPAVLITIVRGPQAMLGREILFREDGDITDPPGNEWEHAVFKLAKETLSQGNSQRVTLNESIDVFLEVILPPPTLIIVGGVHIAIALASLAKTLGYRTIVIDPRKAWGNADRFPYVDGLVHAWPQEAFTQVRLTGTSAVAMLTHDPKLDDPALNIALNSPAFYVGALGSAATHAKRRERLLENGLAESQLARLHAPIGLDIAARSPEEIALAIMAQVVDAHRRQNQPAQRAASD